jgi:hypothetical protein
MACLKSPLFPPAAERWRAVPNQLMLPLRALNMSSQLPWRLQRVEAVVDRRVRPVFGRAVAQRTPERSMWTIPLITGGHRPGALRAHPRQQRLKPPPFLIAQPIKLLLIKASLDSEVLNHNLNRGGILRVL